MKLGIKDVMMAGKGFEIVPEGSYAQKIIGISELGGSLLPVQKLAQFIKLVREETTIMNDATYKTITGSQFDIDVIDMARGVLSPGRDASGTKRIVADADEAGITTQTNSLIPQELIARVQIEEESLEDNIEEDQLQSDVTDLLAKASAEDMEAFLLYADKSITWGSSLESKLLSIADGWLKHAGNKIYGEGTSADFDPNADNYPINMFDALIRSMPKRYIRDRANLRFYVPFDVDDYYSDIIAARGTVIADNALLGKDILTYKKIPIVNAPVLDYEEYTSMVGTPTMLTRPANMYWGMKRNITVRNFYDIDWRRLKNVLSMRLASHYEDVNAVSVAYLDKAKPSS